MKKLILMLFLFVSLKSIAQTTIKSSTNRLPPALTAIRISDLKHDLYYLASDSMHGRRAGMQDEMKAAAWIAQQAQKEGLKPAGDDGTYFQFFPLQRHETTANSEIKINNSNLPLWKDAWVIEPINAAINGNVVWLSSLADTSNQQINGSIVAMNIFSPKPVPPAWVSLWGYRYINRAVFQQASILKAHGAKAVVLVADSTVSAQLIPMEHVLDFKEGSYDLEGDIDMAINNIPVILVQQNYATALQQTGVTFTASLQQNIFTYPSVNVIAEVPGTDANLKKEYVLFSGHHDHDGVGVPIAGDSIWNGADDNASVSVAMLAIGRAFIQHPAKRSALFVWHGAEERGLLGSRWYVQHATVPKERIIAVLNGDMIGRNNPDSAALLGVIPPHRNSIDLVNAAYAANEQTGRFKIDTTWDNAKHPEYWYFRSDHLPYAQAGIPSIMYSTLLHPDYHTPKDERDRIDYPKLTRMTNWIYATGWIIANGAKKPALDAKAKK